MTIKNKDEKLQSYLEANGLVADWEYWSKATSWTLTETAYLIHGIEPTKVLAQGNSYITTGLIYGISAFANAEKDHQLLQRANKDGLIELRNTPLEILNFCDARKIEVPLKLSEICVEVGQAQIAVYKRRKKAREDLADKTQNKNKELGEGKEQNLLQLISIMAELLTNHDKKSSFSSISQMIGYITEKYKDKEPEQSGLSKKALDLVFRDARKIRAIEKPKKKD